MDPLVIFHGVYQILGGVVAAPALFLSSLSGRGGGCWLDRLGLPTAGGGRPYWLHAASVGEAGSAASVIRAWKAQEPGARFVLSVATPAGRAHAERILSDLASAGSVQFMAPPVDVWGAPGRSLDRVDPRALVIIETEIWPGLIRAAARRGVPLVLAAGRVSERTARRFGWARGFFAGLLNSFAKLIVISEADRGRFLKLGADPARTVVMGSPKFDPLIAMARGPAPPPVAVRPPYLVVAGSTHPGEEDLILSELLKTLLSRALVRRMDPVPPEEYALDAGPQGVDNWRNAGREAVAMRRAAGDPSAKSVDDAADAGDRGAPGAWRQPAPGSALSPYPVSPPIYPGNPYKLVLVPRHVNRAREVAELARRKGFETAVITDPEIPLEKLPEVAVFAAMGRLLRLYERCDLAIVGGSWVPGLQGHNPLEPATFGRPSIFGPNMMSFHEQARDLMRMAGCKMILPPNIHDVFTHFALEPVLGSVSGRRGREFIAGLPPAAPGIALAVRRALGAVPEDGAAPGGAKGGAGKDRAVKDAPAADEAKADAAKAGEAKAGEANGGEANTGETKAGEAKGDEAKSDEAKAGEAKAGEAKGDEAKGGEANAGEAKGDEANAGDAKSDEAKAGEAKGDAAQADEAKAREAGPDAAGKDPGGTQGDGR